MSRTRGRIVRAVAAATTAAVALTGSLSCSRKIYREPQTVTAVGGDRFWVAGSEGYASLFDGARLADHDYPRSKGMPDWAYEPGGSDVPAARVVALGESVVLISRVGDVLRWDGRGWTQLAIHFPPEYREPPQIDSVLVSPGGSLVVQIHSQTLIWGTLEELIAHGGRKESTPTYFTWLGFDGPLLLGIGWDETGNTRALHRRTESGAWTLVSRLGLDRVFGTPLCAVTLGDGTPLVVSTYAIVDTSVSDGRAPLTAPVPVLHAPVMAEAQVPDKNGRPYVAKCFPGGTGRVLLTIGSAGEQGNMLELRRGETRTWRCPSDTPWQAIGAIAGSDGWTVVTRQLDRLELPGPQCRTVDSDASVKTIAR